MFLSCMRVCIVVCLLLLTPPAPSGGGVEARRIIVLVSTTAAPYEDMLSGFQQLLQQHSVPFTLQRYVLEGDVAAASLALDDIRQGKNDLIFTLGTLAIQHARKVENSSPLVAGLIVNKEALTGAGNASGVVLEFPLEIQFQWLRRFLPTARAVGVVYNPEDNQPRIEAAQTIARHTGLTLEARPVRTVREIPAALDSLASSVDVLWGLIDNVVLTPQTAKNVLLFSFQQRIPFIGLSTTWVKAGALYALDWDYVDLGRQCGEIALQIFQGTSASAIPPGTPRTVLYTLNQKTARHMKLDIAEALLRGARELF